MSTSQTPPASTPLVTTITNDTLQYAPAVVVGIQAAEQAGQIAAAAGTKLTGAEKFQAVMTGIQAGSGQLAKGTGQVAAIAGLINLFVSIFNSLGIFKHSPQGAA